MVLQEEKGKGHVVLRERSRGPPEGVTWFFRRGRVVLQEGSLARGVRRLGCPEGLGLIGHVVLWLADGVITCPLQLVGIIGS